MQAASSNVGLVIRFSENLYAPQVFQKRCPAFVAQAEIAMERCESLFRAQDSIILHYKARLKIFDKFVMVVRRTLRHTLFIIIGILHTQCFISGKVLV